MENEIKKPELTKPKFFDEPYDYRNYENVGHFRGVGYGDEVGKMDSSKSSITTMPPEAMKMFVPRDHKG